MVFEKDNDKIIIEKDGKEIEYDVLFTFDSEDTNKAYIGYTDNIIASNGRKNIYISSYDPINGPANSLQDVVDERELEMVREVLESIDKEKY